MSTVLGSRIAASARTTPVKESAVPTTMPSATPLRSSRFSATPSVMSSNSTPVKRTASRNSGIRRPLAAPTRWVISFSALTISSVAPEMKTKIEVIPASPSASAAGVRPGDERLVPRARDLVGGPYRRGDDVVVGGQVADRVRARGVAGELERLTAAAAEIDLSALAAAAGVGHPVRAAEALEGLRPLPDPRQGVLPDADPGQRQGVCGRAGQDVAVGHHGELPAAPATHAGFGVPLVVVWEDVDDLHPSLQA